MRWRGTRQSENITDYTPIEMQHEMPPDMGNIGFGYIPDAFQNAIQFRNIADQAGYSSVNSTPEMMRARNTGRSRWSSPPPGAVLLNEYGDELGVQGGGYDPGTVQDLSRLRHVPIPTQRPVGYTDGGMVDPQWQYQSVDDYPPDDTSPPPDTQGWLDYLRSMNKSLSQEDVKRMVGDKPYSSQIAEEFGPAQTGGELFLDWNPVSVGFSGMDKVMRDVNEGRYVRAPLDLFLTKAAPDAAEIAGQLRHLPGAAYNLGSQGIASLARGSAGLVKAVKAAPAMMAKPFAEGWTTLEEAYNRMSGGAPETTPDGVASLPSVKAGPK